MRGWWLVIVAAVGSCAGDEHCSPGEIDDPGPAAPTVYGTVEVDLPADPLYGLEEFTPRSAVALDGQPLAVDSHTARDGGCAIEDGAALCTALARYDEDGETVDAIRFFPPDLREEALIDTLAIPITTGRFAFQDDSVVIDDGFRLELREPLRVVGCDDEINDPRERLLTAGFGVTFYLDAERGEVLQASCVGCE